MHSMLNFEAYGLQHTGCHSYQLRTGNQGYSFHRLSKIGQYKIGKLLPRFQLLHKYGRFRIWHKHESMDPYRLVSTVWGGGVMDIFLEHFGPLGTN